MEYKGKVWENGRGSVGLDTSLERKAKQEKQLNDIYNAAYRLDNRVEDYYERVDGQDIYLGKHTPNEAVELGILGQEERATLGLSNATILRVGRSKPCRKGLNGLTSLGKLQIVNAALRLQKEIGKPRLGLLTLTLPSLPITLLEKLKAVDYKALEKSIYAWLTRKLERAGLKDLGFCGVVEIQGKRFKETGFPYPHWHFICPIKKFVGRGGTTHNPWLFDLKSMSSEFETIVTHWATKLATAYNLYSFAWMQSFRDTTKTFKCSVDLHPCRKDAARYISKYATKGSEIASMQSKCLTHLVPLKWWYVTRALKKRVLSKIIKVVGDVAAHIFLDLRDLLRSKFVYWYRYLETTEGDTYGLSFCLSPPGREYVEDLSRHNVMPKNRFDEEGVLEGVEVILPKD